MFVKIFILVFGYIFLFEGIGFRQIGVEMKALGQGGVGGESVFIIVYRMEFWVDGVK